MQADITDGLPESWGSTGRTHDAAFAHVLQFRAQRICMLIQITDSARWHDAIT